jgi:hypothetical protein
VYHYGIVEKLKGEIIMQTDNAILAPIYSFIGQHQEFNGARIFEGLYTVIALSQSGHIGFYYPYIPYRKAKPFVGAPERPEQKQCLDIIHISQVNSFEFDIEEESTTKARKAMFGGHNFNTTSEVVRVDLIINTTDFNNARVVVPLYKGSFWQMENYPSHLLTYDVKSGAIAHEGKLTKLRNELVKTTYNDGKPPMDRINELRSTLEQMLQSHANAAAQPQIDPTEELVKYKELLDSGVITQEEFDTKKKQLLGL